MEIMGIDIGVTKSGVCLISLPNGVVSAKGVLTVEQTRKFIKKERTKIDLIAIERPIIYTRSAPGVGENLAVMLREVGRLEQLASQYNIPVVLISRADVLKTVVGRRPGRGVKVSKTECQEALRVLLGHTEPIRPQHASDAASCAYAAFSLLNTPPESNPSGETLSSTQDAA